MKTPLLTVLFAAGSMSAFAQGKVTFGNDANHLVAFTWDPACLPTTYVPFAGLPVLQAGTGSTNLSLFTVELLAGTTAGSLTVMSTMNAGQEGFADGRIPNRVVTLLPGLFGGTPAYFQVRVWETAAGTWNATQTGTGQAHWLQGSSPVFVATPGSFLPNPIVYSWPNGQIQLSVAACGWFDPHDIIVWSWPTNLTVVRGSRATFSVGTTGDLSCQWQINGNDIPGANGFSYIIDNVQPTDTGTYSVVLRNSWHTVTVSATLTLLLLPPIVTTPPESQTAEPGANVAFSLQVDGPPPFTYRWLFRYDLLPGATNSALRLINVQHANEGPYSVIVANADGAVASYPPRHAQCDHSRRKTSRAGTELPIR